MNLSIVRNGSNNAKSKRGQAMRCQDTISDQQAGNDEQPQGIIVPLDLPELAMMSSHGEKGMSMRRFYAI